MPLFIKSADCENTTWPISDRRTAKVSVAATLLVKATAKLSRVTQLKRDRTQKASVRSFIDVSKVVAS